MEKFARQTTVVVRNLFVILLLAAVVTSGCTTKSKARADAQTAFYAGQARALSDQLATKTPPPAPPNTVSIIGPVQVSALIWTSDLTLVKTIVAAEYIPAGEPSRITIFRSGQRISVNAATLLNGDDVPILPRDVVELEP
jgi:ABC-type Fe3+-hydroxamate transport system substrate-binding protein